MTLTPSHTRDVLAALKGAGRTGSGLTAEFLAERTGLPLQPLREQLTRLELDGLVTSSGLNGTWEWRITPDGASLL